MNNPNLSFDVHTDQEFVEGEEITAEVTVSLHNDQDVNVSMELLEAIVITEVKRLLPHVDPDLRYTWLNSFIFTIREVLNDYVEEQITAEAEDMLDHPGNNQFEIVLDPGEDPQQTVAKFAEMIDIYYGKGGSS